MVVVVVVVVAIILSYRAGTFRKNALKSMDKLPAYPSLIHGSIALSVPQSSETANKSLNLLTQCLTLKYGMIQPSSMYGMKH